MHGLITILIIVTTIIIIVQCWLGREARRGSLTKFASRFALRAIGISSVSLRYLFARSVSLRVEKHWTGPPLEVASDLPRSDLVRRFTSEFPKVVLSRETSSKISRVPWPLEEAFSSFIKPSRLCPPKSDFDHQDGFKKAFLVLLRAIFGPLEGMFGPSCMQSVATLETI